ncbi:MAG: hypothetical protein JO050_11190 [Acidimicrobiia bacterium]|nr:hypothetical protein [Acidimicrobiia bacterium]
MVDALETLRHDLLPAPSPPIGLAFVTYVDALLDLYRQCPASRGRAVELHDRAKSVGRVFEDLVNAALSGSTWPN